MPGDQPLLEITVGREGFRFGEIAVVVRALSGTGGPRDPDDEPVVVRAAGHAATLCHADRHADPALDELLGRWERLAERVTGGALPYGWSSSAPTAASARRT